jgi:hypothetical protein
MFCQLSVPIKNSHLVTQHKVSWKAGDWYHIKKKLLEQVLTFETMAQKAVSIISTFNGKYFYQKSCKGLYSFNFMY